MKPPITDAAHRALHDDEQDRHEARTKRRLTHHAVTHAPGPIPTFAPPAPGLVGGGAFVLAWTLGWPLLALAIGVATLAATVVYTEHRIARFRLAQANSTPEEVDQLIDCLEGREPHLLPDDGGDD